jgi:multiple sugar transport system permease protein
VDPGGRRQRRAFGHRVSGRLLGMGMLLPAAAMLTVVIIIPIVYSAVLSTAEWGLTDMNGDKPFVGFTNFERLWSDPDIRKSLINTFIFVVASVGTEVAVGFVIANALFEVKIGKRFANALILLPMMTTPVVTGLVWRYLLDPQFGLLSQVMRGAGSAGGMDWFGSQKLALPALILIDFWQWTPFCVLVLHAGMLSIPEHLFEAARIDGASRIQIIKAIMIPALVPQFLLVLLFRTMDTFRVFDTVFLLTKGGPARATETVGFFNYKTGFEYFDMGYAMAQSIMMLVAILLFSVPYIRLLRKRSMI